MEQIKVYCGDIEKLNILTKQPFDEDICDYLDIVSQRLLHNKIAIKYSDIIAFAYFIRKNSIESIRNKYTGRISDRLGRGIIFHIAPGNVPINFAFTLVFGLLSGNVNIVKASSKDFIQTQIIAEEFKNVCSENEQYAYIIDYIKIIAYDRDSKALTDKFSELCNVRVIWGGDNTINMVRNSPLRPRAFDVTFSDRYSLCILDAYSVICADNKELHELAIGFYNDTFLYDQNACSSPRLIYWVGDDDCTKSAQKRFWDEVHGLLLSRYKIDTLTAIEKKLTECKCAINLKNVTIEAAEDNLISRIRLSKLVPEIQDYRCPGGSFLEYNSVDFQDLLNIIDEKYQTISYYGIECENLLNKAIAAGLQGVDRIVPVGKTLEMGIVWDGYDLIESLSRKIVCYVSE